MADKIKVLVIDDNKIIGDVFNFFLGAAGHHIQVVTEPNKAFDILKEETFDIAFVDIIMPEINGLEVLERIKTISPELPIVMMSGFTVMDQQMKAKELGAVTCLKKPFISEDIRKVIKETIGKEI